MGFQIKQLIQEIFLYFGMEINKRGASVNEVNFYYKISKKFDFSVVYDIGAHKGEFSKSICSFFPGARFYLFEANPVHKEFLEATGFLYEIVLLFEDERDLPFYELGSTGESIYKENYFEGYNKVKPVLRKTKSLDKLTVEKNYPQPDLIKLDVQGAELDILKGSKRLLSNVKFICLELPMCEYNVGSANFASTTRYLQDQGFVPYDIIELHHQDSILVQVDIAYINTKYYLETIKGELPAFVAGVGQKRVEGTC